MPPVGEPAGPDGGDARDDRIDDELADPEDGDGDERPNRPQQQDGDRVAAVRLIDEPHERGDVFQGGEPLAPGGRRVGAGPLSGACRTIQPPFAHEH